MGCYRAARNGIDEVEMVLKKIVKPVDKKILETYLPMKLYMNHLIKG